MNSYKSIYRVNSDKPYLKSYETKLFKKNKIIYSKGQKVDFVYIILNGQVSSILEKSAIKKANILLEKGSSLGLMDLILDRYYSKTMIAQETSVLVIIKKNYFLNIIKPGQFETILLKSLAIDIDKQHPNVWS